MKAIGWMLIFIVLAVLFGGSVAIIGFKTALCICGIVLVLSVVLVAGMNLIGEK